MATRVATASERGERLYPSRTSRIYWHLVCLRRAIETVAERFICGRELGTLVDYGSGNSPYRPLFEPHVEQYLSAELGDGAGCATPRLALGPDGTIPMDEGTSDVVLSTQVLEHVPDPAAYLAECRRVLHPDGLLVLSTHGVWPYHPDPTDYWRWTRDGLVKQVEAAGFQVQERLAVMGPLATALQLLQDATLPFLPSWLRPLHCTGFQVAIQLGDRITGPAIRDRNASVYVIVAGKDSADG